MSREVRALAVTLVALLSLALAATVAFAHPATPLSLGAGSLGNYDYDGVVGHYHTAGSLAPQVTVGRGQSTAPARPVAHASGFLVASSDELDAPRAPGLVDEAATVGRSASTEWGRVVQNFQQHRNDWTRFSAHVEQATGRAYRGGTSIEEIFRRGDDWLVRHRIYGQGGDVLHETFRPYSKFGQ